jgi:hypothetical protein
MEGELRRTLLEIAEFWLQMVEEAAKRPAPQR